MVDSYGLSSLSLNDNETSFKLYSTIVGTDVCACSIFVWEGTRKLRGHPPVRSVASWLKKISC